MSSGQRDADGRLLYDCRNMEGGEEVTITRMSGGWYEVTCWRGDEHRWSRDFPDEVAALKEFNRWT